jgi:hypothetical protein
VAFSGGELWVGYVTESFTSDLAVLDRATGEVVRSETTDIPATPFVTADGRVAAVDYASPTTETPPTLVVRDGATGSTLWSYDFTELNQVPLPGGGVSSSSNTPTLAHGRIYVANASTILAFDAGCSASPCSPVWTLSLASGGSLRTPVAGPDGEVFVIEDFAQGAQIHALDGATGAVVWSASYFGECDPFGNLCANGGITGVAVSGQTVFVAGFRDALDGTRTASLSAYATAGCDGQACAQWTAPVQGQVIVGGSVAYVGHDSSVEAFDVDGCGSATCSPLTTVALPGTLAKMSVAQGKLFVQASSPTPTLAAYTAPT